MRNGLTAASEREVGHGHDKSGEARERTGLPSLSGTGKRASGRKRGSTEVESVDPGIAVVGSGGVALCVVAHVPGDHASVGASLCNTVYALR